MTRVNFGVFSGYFDKRDFVTVLRAVFHNHQTVMG